MDVAIEAANRLDVPVFVYHAVSERYRYASDRHHTFILEGARDVARQLEQRGIGTAFHCERPGHRGRHLETLARQAALVVTEEMPVSPLRDWTRGLADSLQEHDVPTWAVDTACVVPMRVMGKGIERAFAYRKRMKPHLKRFITEWHDAIPDHPAFVPPLPFEPVDWATQRIDALVAACDIDHSVGPVPHTRGGSMAGYARWERFRDQGMGSYSRDRNDPNRHGVSRMSAYLHYGMVAPTRLAREAQRRGGRGAEKYLDELLVWRELAYTWCLYQRDHESVSALPEWAVETLREHRRDPRPAFDRETLERGATGDDLWDLAQASLRMHGELHNNVRMTWGKALVGWAATPEEALANLVDLNHRYALDGRDPASYGGLLWCLGLFDRPFPQSPVFGRLRTRSLEFHADRLDLRRYEAHVHRRLAPDPPRVAVIGAGPAGAICARTLADHGLDVVVFDKGRGAGGRLSTRRAGPRRFDHGAQYFTVRDRYLARRVAAWERAGVIARWRGTLGRIGEDGAFHADDREQARYVGVPGMSGVVKHLLNDIGLSGNVRFSERVEALAQVAGRWRLLDADGQALDADDFDEVVVAVPAPQAAPLLGKHAFAADVAKVEIAPCWAVMADVVGEPAVPWVGARIACGPLSWVARDNTKPGRPLPHVEQWVLHASPDWSRAHLEADRQEVAGALVASLNAIPGLEHVVVHEARAHRWRYARVTQPVGEPSLYDPAARLGVCGDALLGGRVESALVSGVAAAGRILGRLSEESEQAEEGQLSLFPPLGLTA